MTPPPPRLAFVTPLASHFHRGLFERLAQRYDVDFLFFSDGSERYLTAGNRLETGRFHAETLRGWRLSSRLRINVPLVRRLWTGGYDAIVQSTNGRFEPLAAFAVARRRGVPFILWANLWQQPDTWFHRLSFPVIRSLYRRADALVTYGPHIDRYLAACGADPARLFHSWNTTDNERYNRPVADAALTALRDRFGLRDRRVILFVGRMCEEKGVRYLLEAFRDLAPDLRASLLLVGDGERRAAHEAFIREHGLAHAHVVPHVPNAELPAWYALADVLVLPSITTRTFKEPWGIVINEAMNQGCPALATDAVGAAMGGLIVPGENGLVVPERNAPALRDALAALLGDPSRLAAMRRRTREIIAGWTHEKSALGFDAAIASALARRPPRKHGSTA